MYKRQVEGPWVELKAGKLPKRSTTRIQYSEGVRVSQNNWHKKAASRGVISYVLVRVEEKKSEPLLFAGTASGDINNLTWDEACSRSIAIGWTAIFERLTS